MPTFKNLSPEFLVWFSQKVAEESAKPMPLTEAALAKIQTVGEDGATPPPSFGSTPLVQQTHLPLQT
jgi:hypothetical protein